MQKSAIILLLLFGCSISFGTPVKLGDALQSKKININVHGNSASTHYLEPLVAELTNAGNEAMTIAIESGDMFIPDDAAKQNIVVTGNQMLTLQPNEKKSVKIKGMCTESSDGCGSDETTYKFQAAGNANLKKLATFIDSKKYQTSTAQYAVWSLMNNDDLNSIYGADSTEENDLKKFMASLTGKTFAIKNKTDYRTNYYAPPVESVGGNFEYNFNKAKDVQIAMFDKNGILVRELFNQKKVAAGDHKFHFEFDSGVYTDDVYYFKLIVDNEVMVDQNWDIKEIRDRFKQKIENRD